MDVSTNEFRFSRADSNVSKFTRYSKNVAPPSSSKIKDELAIPSETGDSKKKHFRYTSACDIKTNPLYIPQLDRLSPKMPQNLTTVFSSLEIRSISSSVSNAKSKLTVLDLSNTNLTAFPVDIFDYSTLRTLRLDHNNIKEIPLEITNFSKLETLTISFNKLVCLPRTISSLTFLQELNLESNTIETISDEICGLKALKVLNLCHNRLGYMPCSLKDLVSLVEFNSEWFHYTKPRLCALQKGKEGVYNITKMRNKMVDLAKRKVKGMTFKYFLEFFSTEKINFTDIDGLGRSILHYASLNQDLSVIRYLCTSLPELKNVQDKEDLTPFGLCLLKDKFKSCEYLLAQGIDLTKGIGKFGSLLHVATKKLHLPLVKQLIFTGSDLLTIDSLGNTPLHYAVTSMVDNYDKSVPIVQFLLENSVNPNAKNKENWTPLHLVARKGAIQPLEWIINYNLEVKEVYGGDQLFKLDKRGGAFKWTPLHIAGYTGASKMIQILGDAGADFFKTSAHGYKPKAMIRRPGLPLKLIEKFEKDFIKKNILKKKRIYTRNFTCHTVQSPSHTREIHNASKNKFKESFSSLNLLHLSKQEPSRLGMSFFGRSTNGLIFNSPPSKIHSKRQIDDSVEITPETETGLADSLDGNLLTEMEAAENIGLDSESVDVGADLYLLGGPMSDKTTNGLFNTSQAWQNKSIKQKNNTNLFFFTDLNLETYKHKVNNPKVFALEDLKDELEFLAESLISTKLALSEKLKLLLALRVLHSAVIDHIYKKFTVPVRKESLPAYAMNSSGWRSPRGNSILGLKKDDQQIIFFYDQVPQRLISAYWALENKDHKNIVLKQNICKMLGDMKYLSGVEFLQRVMDAKNENPMVVMEAKCARTMLNTQIQLNEPQKVNQDFLKKQYAKTLNPKANFSLKAPL